MNGLSAVPAHDAVVLYRSRDNAPEHETVIHRDIAMRIADLMDVPFDGFFDPVRHADMRCYFLPSDTLVGADMQMRLGVSRETDLFGGYSGFAFMPTKAITHGLVSSEAQRPEGWSDAFSRQIEDAVLPGYTAFGYDDLRDAARRLLAQAGVIRLKPVQATAGRGQIRISDVEGLEASLEKQDAATLAKYGVVLETHLDDVFTYSVGQVRLPGLTASYIGTQRLTHDNDGEAVYGGSRLQFTRGGYDALQALALDDDSRRAVELAGRYDAAADACSPDFFASRRNYDVAAGIDAHGQRRMGVLEQSWRVGGASRAEIAAVEVLVADPGCDCLWAETLELFGTETPAPPDAVETFSGTDPDLGLIRKYVMVEAYGNQQRYG